MISGGIPCLTITSDGSRIGSLSSILSLSLAYDDRRYFFQFVHGGGGGGG